MQIVEFMKGELHNTLRQKLNDSLVAEIPRLTRREIRLPAAPGKALAVIGMRRSGKNLLSFPVHGGSACRRCAP